MAGWTLADQGEARAMLSRLVDEWPHMSAHETTAMRAWLEAHPFDMAAAMAALSGSHEAPGPWTEDECGQARSAVRLLLDVVAGLRERDEHEIIALEAWLAEHGDVSYLPVPPVGPADGA